MLSSKKAILKKFLFVNSINLERIDLRSSNLVFGSVTVTAIGPGNKVFVKIAHAQKVAAIEIYMFFRDCKKLTYDFD